MPMYDVKVVVTYEYEVEADNEEQAEEMGWYYEEYPFAGEVYSIKVYEQDEKDDEVELDEEVI